MIVLFQQDIAAVADAGVRKYHEDTEIHAVTTEGVAMAMKSCIKDATEKVYKKLSKIVAMENPALGQDWLEEVKLPHLLISYIVCTYTMMFVC